MAENFKNAQKIKREEGVQIERGRMTYKKHETSMDYLEQAINKFRNRQIGGIKRFSDILIGDEKLYGQVKDRKSVV